LGVEKLLMSRGADHSISEDRRGRTPLITASAKDNTAVVRYLLSFRAVRTTASLDVRNSYGETALWSAVLAVGRHVEVVKLLLEAGANPMVANNDGRTPMDIAEGIGHRKCIELLQVIN